MKQGGLTMGYILGWLLGIPITVLVIIWVLTHIF
jgi:hypothetical protein